MAFVKAAKANEVNPTKTVRINNIDITLFNVGGQIYALDNKCPHRGGPLGEGNLDGEIVTCPWHGWRFNVTTGKNAMMPVGAKTYKTKVEDGHVFVEM